MIIKLQFILVSELGAPTPWELCKWKPPKTQGDILMGCYWVGRWGLCLSCSQGRAFPCPNGSII